MGNSLQSPSVPIAGKREDALNSGGLGCLFEPGCIAVIGATERAGSIGRAVMENLAEYKGKLIPINPKHETVLGLRTFGSLSGLERKPDLAIIATPAETVPALVRQCVENQIQAGVILSAGFREAGAQGEALEREILEARGSAPFRFLGPNCLGLLIPRLSLNATFAHCSARPGSVAFLSQSGALCTAVLDWSLRENAGFSAFVSTGAMLDIGWGDLISYFGNDPHTRSIVCYMESAGEAREFLSAAREVSRNKPIIILKAGQTEAGAKAAASHTGAITGSDAVLDAAFRRAGVVRVGSVAELFDMAEVLAKQPRPHGPRLAIVTNAGGPGALAADMLVSNHGEVAPLAPETMRELNSFLPPFWSRGNPIDILGDADPARYERAVQLALRDPTTNGVLAILTPQAMTDATESAARIAALAKTTAKPILASWMGGLAIDEGEQILNAASIPTFRTPDMAARCFALMWQYSENLRSLYETPALCFLHPEKRGMREKVSRRLARLRGANRTILNEVEAKRILRCYGIPTAATTAVRTEEAAVRRAAEMGFPVVLKLLSNSITHKAEVGGVHLNLRGRSEVRRAWRAMKSALAKIGREKEFLGAAVQPMVQRTGIELIAGSSIDPQFGPVLAFGAGGAHVEIFKDIALELPPLNSTLAARLIERTRIYRALQGVRGAAPVNLAELAEILVRFSQIIAEQPAISEIEINPLLASREGFVALDARVVLHSRAIPEEQLPALAIRPYPMEYAACESLKNGAVLRFRPIRAEDEPALARFHQTLSDRTVYFRYFTPMKLDQRVAHERLSRICFIDYAREMALVVEHAEAHQIPRIVAVGRLSRCPEPGTVEFALLVADEWQQAGIGTLLLGKLIEIARQEKFRRLTALILGDNEAMVRLARKLGFALAREPGSTEWKAEYSLQAQAKGEAPRRLSALNRCRSLPRESAAICKAARGG